MTTVTQADVERWGIPFERVVARAADNLRRRHDGDDEGWIALTDGLWMAPWDDAYAASRLLLPPPQSIPRATRVAVPNRETLLLADENVPGALAALVEAMEKLERHEFPISPAIYRWSGEAGARARLQDAPLGDHHPSSLAHHNLRTRFTLRAYADEQWPRQQLVGDAVYVATAEAEPDRGGRLLSRALWTEGVATLLPAVERIHLLPAARDGVTSRLWVAPLEAVASLPGALERLDGPLERFATRRFLGELEIRRIAVPVERDPATAALDASAGR